jgi:hypothetical protein
MPGLRAGALRRQMISSPIIPKYALKGTGIFNEKVDTIVKAYAEGTKVISLEEVDEIFAAMTIREELPYPEEWDRSIAEVSIQPHS